MKNIEVHVDESTSHTFVPYSAELHVRGVVTFAMALEGVDLEFLTKLLYPLVDGKPRVDSAGEEYKRFEMDVSAGDNDDKPSNATTLRIRYAGDIAGHREEISLNLPESSLVEFWNANGGELAAEAAKLEGALEQAGSCDHKNALTLALIVSALRFVSGEAAEFTQIFSAWAAAHDRAACVSFPSMLPLAA